MLNCIEDIFKIIYDASSLGNLGLFVGAGFTKAILENTNYDAFSWFELLMKCSENMSIDYNFSNYRMTCPEIASDICKKYAEKNSCLYEESVVVLKETVANLTNYYLDNDVLNEYRDYFNGLNTDWIVTTNYDTVLESILYGKSFAINSSESFVKIRELIPIYHIHGIKTFPETIVITNEDYVSLFRPADYRKDRIPFLIKESTVIMIGYGLGDINILSAVDWSKNVYQNNCSQIQTKLIQLLYVNEIDDFKIRKGDNEILIVEMNSINNFFEKYKQFVCKYEEANKKELQYLDKFINMLSESDSKSIEMFIDNSDNYRKETIIYMSQLSIELSYVEPIYLEFLREVIRNIDEESKRPKKFGAYAKKLELLVDLLNSTDPHKGVLFSFLAEELNYLGYRVGYNMGESWEAADKWKNLKDTIREEVLNEICNYKKSKICHGLKKLFESQEFNIKYDNLEKINIEVEDLVFGSDFF